MMRNDDFLRRPAPRASRQVARQLLKRTRKLSKQVDPSDRDSLHAFRVSLRRLQNHLHAYSYYLGPDAKAYPKRLDKIAALTGQYEDAKAQEAWLETHLKKRNLAKLQRQGMKLLVANLGTAAGKTEPLEKAQRRLKKHDPKLKKALKKLSPNEREALSFAEATAGIVEREATALRAQLESVASCYDAAALHKLHLQVKKLRYILEAAPLPAAQEIAERLKDLQSQFGAFHDVQTLEPRLRKLSAEVSQDWSQTLLSEAEHLTLKELDNASEPQDTYALAAVQVKLEAEKRRLFDKLEKRWLGENNVVFFAKLEALVAELMRCKPVSET